MKIKNLLWVTASASAFVFAVACSSSSGDDSAAGNDAGGGGDTSTPTDSGGGPKDSGGGGSCKKLADGTYTIHYSGPDGGPSCPPPDSTVTIGAGDGGDAGGIPSGCTDDTSPTTCAETVACDSTNGGYEAKINITETPAADGNSATGTYSVIITAPDGGPFSSCTGITTTYTKE